jgi:hypothetical protein
MLPKVVQRACLAKAAAPILVMSGRDTAATTHEEQHRRLIQMFMQVESRAPQMAFLSFGHVLGP